YDCVSTLRLFEFLHQIREKAGIELAEPDSESGLDSLIRETTDQVAAERRAERAARLERLVEALEPHEPLLGAAVGYHRRETNPAWWEFFRQLAAPLSELEVDAGCAVPVSVEAGQWVPPAGRARL